VRSIAVLLGLAVGLGAAPLARGQEAAPGRGPGGAPVPSITVTGSATESTRPDTAEVIAGVVTQAVTAAQALAQNSAAMQRVLAALRAAGIAERDIQTTGLSVIPRRPPPRPDAPLPDIAGYEVSNEVRVKVRDLARLGRVLDEMVAQSANSLRGIRFSIADPAPLLDRARAAAVADARRRAQVYAAAAGVRVGRVLDMRELFTRSFVPVSGLMRTAAAEVPVAPGEESVEASVTITFAIE
jgi:uncharacterized protein YggE